MSYGLSSPNRRLSVQSLGIQELLQRYEKMRMEAEGAFLVPCGDFMFSGCECSGPQVQEVTVTSAPSL